MKNLHLGKFIFSSFVIGFVMLFAASTTFAAYTRSFSCWGAITYFQNIDSSKYSSVTFNFDHEPEELEGLEVCTFVPFTPNKTCVYLDGTQDSITMDLDDPSKTYTLKIGKSDVELPLVLGTYTVNDRE
ncbi:hypothetical protein IC620_12140 [Hazenella sp. IB182357]|uniref:Uncharacterized protein n=1 Tax=Polycladospora coralii TaxID=2771432 RepID=A0A926NGE1_9BACL|nr:hypothetical protein [Polycladospora coralii]MBD1373104.1 hypothetical protein [Polycladospora coralii]MBS7531662.1 hypothetical protein [Polycladospora coralii]